MNPVGMDHQQRMQVRAAAFRAARVYPGPVGESLRRELLDWADFGYRFGGRTLVTRLIEHLSTAPLATTDAA